MRSDDSGGGLLNTTFFCENSVKEELSKLLTDYQSITGHSNRWIADRVKTTEKTIREVKAKTKGKLPYAGLVFNLAQLCTNNYSKINDTLQESDLFSKVVLDSPPETRKYLEFNFPLMKLKKSSEVRMFEYGDETYTKDVETFLISGLCYQGTTFAKVESVLGRQKARNRVKDLLKSNVIRAEGDKLFIDKRLMFPKESVLCLLSDTLSFLDPRESSLHGGFESVSDDFLCQLREWVEELKEKIHEESIKPENQGDRKVIFSLNCGELR